MACWICHYGDALDEGVCNHCKREGYGEVCHHGCYTDPQGYLHECETHEPRLRLTLAEQYQAALKDPRRS